MPNKKYINALDRKIKIFKEDFLNFSREQYQENEKLINPGEFGSSREKICKQLIDSIIPSSRGIDTRGFIINSSDGISTEQDLIFYSKNDTPVLTLENTKFFPIETVVGIGQIKSCIKTKNELQEILEKLSCIKSLRDNMGHDSVVWRGQDLYDGKNSYSTNNPYDQIFTFLICEKMNFKIDELEIDSLYGKNVKQHQKHNFILDLNAGSYAYVINDDGIFIGCPYSVKGNSNPSFIKSDSSNMYIKHFLINLHIYIAGNTIFHPDMAHYIKKI